MDTEAHLHTFRWWRHGKFVRRNKLSRGFANCYANDIDIDDGGGGGSLINSGKKVKSLIFNVLVFNTDILFVTLIECMRRKPSIINGN